MSSEPLQFDRNQRWRLILGKRVEDQLKPPGGGACLGGEQGELDEALGAVYDEEGGEGGEGGPSGRKRSAGLGKGSGRVAKWLGDVRKYFSHDVVVLLQHDAIERKGLRQLLFEPETLAQITPSVDMVGTLLAMKDLVPEEARATAREIVRAVVEDIIRRLAPRIEQALRGALDRSRHQPIPSLPNLDWRRTIARNLKNYVPSRRVVIPERFFFWSRQHRRKEWNVIVCMDQSGSMAESVIYGSLMGAIFATMPALESHVVAFDTEVVDLSKDLHDPVELLFGVQLGGGTDINRAVGYCQGLVRDAQHTLFILITDLFEGGNKTTLLKRLEEMVHSGVRAVCLLALSDSGVPSYDESLAASFAKLGVPSFACTPNALPEVLEAMLKGHDLNAVAARFKTHVVKP